MEFQTLTELQYSVPSWPLRLFIFHEDGYHRGGIWFEPKPRYPEEGELSTEQALPLILAAIEQGREVRIANGGDLLVFHSVDGVTLFPESWSVFWAAVAALPVPE